MKLLSCLIVSLLIFSNVNAEMPKPTGSYLNHVTLMQPDIYKLYWNYTDVDITFEVIVKTSGWFGFGLSPNGAMEYSDVVVGFYPPGSSTPHFTDRHILPGRQVLVDAKQDWFLDYSKRDGDYLIFKFHRKITLCDPDNQDLDIDEGTPYVIFSHGSNFKENDIANHGRNNRGQMSVPLINSLNQPIELDMDEVDVAEFRVDAQIRNGVDTDYYCHMFKLPDEWIKEKRHLIRFETLVQPGNEKLVHHFLLYECDMYFEKEYLPKHNNTIPEPQSCFLTDGSFGETEMTEALNVCNKATLAWAVGGSYIEDFPADKGYPIGGEDAEFKYFILEMHYDNPEMKMNLRDNSGIKLYATKKHRPIEFGIVGVGASSSWNGLLMPPGAENYQTDFLCPSGCVNKLFNQEDEEVYVFASLPHTHLTGVEVYSKIVKNGEEVKYLTKNKHFDFNYQFYNYLKEPVAIKRGDEIKQTCLYTTTDRSGYVVGGLDTRSEMCISFLWYYPKSNNKFKFCYSRPDYMETLNFLSSLNSTGDMVLNPDYMSSFISAFHSIKQSKPKLSPELIKRFKEFHDRSNKELGCDLPDNQYHYETRDSIDTINMKEDDKCSSHEETSNMTATSSEQVTSNLVSTHQITNEYTTTLDKNHANMKWQNNLISKIIGFAFIEVLIIKLIY